MPDRDTIIDEALDDIKERYRSTLMNIFTRHVRFTCGHDGLINAASSLKLPFRCPICHRFRMVTEVISNANQEEPTSPES